MRIEWKIYALMALAFIAAAIRWRSSAVEDALATAEAERDRRTLEAITRAQETRYEIENMDDERIKRLASKWVRNKS